MKEGNKKRLSIEELTANAEKVLKDKELNPKGREAFEKVIKKASTPKQHGSKPSQT